MPVKDLKRWSIFCTSSTDISQPQPLAPFERSLSFSSISPSSTLNFSSYENHYLKSSLSLQSFEPKNFWAKELPKDHPEQRLTMFPISSNPTTPTSTSSSEIRDQMESQCVLPRFNEYNAENLRTIRNALERKAPWQKEIVFDIASTVLRCRSGMAKRKGKHVSNDNDGHGIKEDTCLFFQGSDVDAKEKIARELARLIFGSEEKFISIALSSFSSTRVEASEDRNKRGRDEQNCNYVERFAEAILSNPHRVFFLEDIEQVDYSSQMGIKKAIERGKIAKYLSGKEASFCDAIVILSCESFRSRSRACSPSTKIIADVSSKEDDPASSSVSLDLNISINGGEEIDDNTVHGKSMDEIGLLASVDRCVFFTNHQDY